tara:strand:+ start:279 stop:497 length:219 start_codon:yes stop_codon:yes gene_type:complete
METIKATSLTFEQFQTTDYYKKRFDAELVRDLSLEGALNFMKQTLLLLCEYDAILDGVKVKFPETKKVTYLW